MIFLSKALKSQLRPLRGMVAALDWGQKRIGWATADPEGIVITPRGHWVRPKLPKKDIWQLKPEDIAQLKKIREEWEIEHWVLGWPVNKGGIETEASRNCSLLAQELEKALGEEITLVDESLSSWEQKNSGDVDSGAAATILSDSFAQRARLLKSGNVKLAALAVFVLVIGVGALFGKFYYDFSYKKVGGPNAPTSLIIDVQPGSTFHSVKAQIERDFSIAIHPVTFKLWSYLHLGNAKLRIGEYRIQSSWSAQRIFQELIKGSPLLYKIVIKEGFNRWDILQTLSINNPNRDITEFEKLFTDRSLLEDFDFLKTQSYQPETLEGFLFPETYSFQKYDSSKKLVLSMLDQFKKRALPILERHPWAKQPGGIYRLLILASIVEKESGDTKEQPIIASVFWNRLAKRMKLQSDPTTIYGLMPQFDGNLTKSQLLTPTPWNTYTIRELPLTPIANPGITAISAVVDPAPTNYLFFVSRNDGTHVFSADYKTHNSYVQEFQVRRRKAAANVVPEAKTN